MSVRRVVLSVVLVLMATVAAAEKPPAQVESLPRIRVTFAPPRDLSDERLLGIRRNVDEIWRPYGVQLVWDRGDWTDPVPPLAWVLVLVRPSQPGDPDPLPPSFHLGSLHRRSGSQTAKPGAVIYTTLARVRTLAWRAVMDTQLTAYGNPPTGLVDALLARVIAHELGHYLLDSDVHAPNGLMRESFDRRDAMGGSVNRYSLAPSERGRLVAAMAARTGSTLVAER